jgi:hypothetical protein
MHGELFSSCSLAMRGFGGQGVGLDAYVESSKMLFLDNCRKIEKLSTTCSTVSQNSIPAVPIPDLNAPDCVVPRLELEH